MSDHDSEKLIPFKIFPADAQKVSKDFKVTKNSSKQSKGLILKME